MYSWITAKVTFLRLLRVILRKLQLSLKYTPMHSRTAQSSQYQSPSRPQPRLAYSPQRFKTQQRKSRTSQLPLTRPIYFCHYRNAMYMGGIRSTDKHGLGLILHDNGSSAITHYQNDMLSGHNVIVTGDSEILSLEYNRGKVQEAVYRSREEMLFVRYKEGFVEGDAIMVDYGKREINYARFVKGGVVARRTETDHILIERVFNLRQLDLLLPKKHAKALTFELEFSSDLLVSRKSSKISVGFSKNKHIEGLGFTLLVKLPDNANQQPYPLVSERGMYSVSRLDGLGERRFQNGNVYMGEFSNDLFHGSGLLLNTVKKNWVCGQFAHGNLVELTSYDNDGKQVPTENVLAELHRKKSSWRDVEITLPDALQFKRQARKIQTYRPDKAILIDVQSRKQQILKRIQSNFTHQPQFQPQTEHSNDSLILQKAQPHSLSSHPSKKVINQFEISNDAATHKVKLKPLDIPPDLRKKVQEKDRQEKAVSLIKGIEKKIEIRERERQPKDSKQSQMVPEIKVTSPTSPFGRQQTDRTNSTGRKRIFTSGQDTGKNHSPVNRQTAVGSSDRRQTLSSSKRNRIFSTNRRTQTFGNNHTQNSLENKETARLGQEYSPIISKRSEANNSIEESKRFVGPRAKIFGKDGEEEAVSFRYSRYVGKTPESRGSSSRRNRIF